MAAHDAEDSGHTQAAPREFGREERIEDLLDGLGVHTATRVGHFDISVNTFGRRVQAGSHDLIDIIEICAVAVHCAGRQGDDAALVADGFRGVGDQVHDNLADLRHVAVEGGQVLGEVVLEHGLLRN